MKLIVVLLLILTSSSVSSGQSDRDRGIELFRAGKYAEATELLEKLRTGGNADYTSALYLGASYVKAGQNQQATEIFGKLQTFPRPKNPTVYERKIKVKERPLPRFGRDVGAGQIQLAVELKADGKVGFIFPVSSTSEILLQGAIDAAKKIKFEPAILNKDPVSVVLIFEYSFK